ncbi:MAG: DUF1080 domain-containing protein [Bryobacteraceae bacterium]
MRRIIPGLTIGLGLTIVAAAAAADWRDLFNGRNLDGWQVVGDGKWVVLEGGILMAQATDGGKIPFSPAWPVSLDEKKYHDWRQTQSWLYTTQEFGDYDLHLEYLTAPGGNSGISIRDSTRGKYAIGPSPDYSKTPAHFGYEIQILNGVKTKYPTGSIYLFAPAEFGHEKQGGWNALDIESRKQGIRILLNGREVAKFAGEPGRPVTGPVGLQLHDRFSVIWFRNIRIRDVAPR